MTLVSAHNTPNNAAASMDKAMLNQCEKQKEVAQSCLPQLTINGIVLLAASGTALLSASALRTFDPLGISPIIAHYS